MARTPLLGALQNLFREYRTARAAGLPLSGLREQRAARRAATARDLTRRELLAGAAAGALTLALPRRVRARGADPAVAIVAGGVAGVTCAVQPVARGIA